MGQQEAKVERLMRQLTVHIRGQQPGGLKGSHRRASGPPQPPRTSDSRPQAGNIPQGPVFDFSPKPVSSAT